MWDKLSVRRTPLMWNQIFVMAETLIQPNENFTMSMVLSGPSGTEIARQRAQNVRAPAGATGNTIAKMAFAFYGLNFPEFGEYHIEIFIDDLSVHSIPFEIVQRQRL